MITNNKLREELSDMQRMFERTDYYNSEFNQFCLGFRRIADKVLTGSQIVKISQILNSDEVRERVTGLPISEAISDSLQKRSESMSGYLADIIQGRRVTFIHYHSDNEKISQVLRGMPKPVKKKKKKSS